MERRRLTPPPPPTARPPAAPIGRCRPRRAPASPPIGRRGKAVGPHWWWRAAPPALSPPVGSRRGGPASGPSALDEACEAPPATRVEFSRSVPETRQLLPDWLRASRSRLAPPSHWLAQRRGGVHWRRRRSLAAALRRGPAEARPDSAPWARRASGRRTARPRRTRRSTWWRRCWTGAWPRARWSTCSSGRASPRNITRGSRRRTWTAPSSSRSSCGSTRRPRRATGPPRPATGPRAPSGKRGCPPPPPTTSRPRRSGRATTSPGASSAAWSPRRSSGPPTRAATSCSS